MPESRTRRVERRRDQRLRSVTRWPVNYYQMLAELEDSIIRYALRQERGIVERAARAMGLKRTTLIQRMRKFEITKEEYRDVSNVSRASLHADCEHVPAAGADNSAA